jgi:beta-carotene 3-hydroxylase
MFGSADEPMDDVPREFPPAPRTKPVSVSGGKKRLTRSEREKNGESYEWSAWVSTCGVTSIAITATYLRLLREVSEAGVFPWAELFAQLALVAGAAVGMEYYARYAHKYLWHDTLWTMPLKARKEWNRPIWLLHESHHLPREGAFEANDIFAIANGVPAFALCAYGFLTPGVFGGLCFGAGFGHHLLRHRVHVRARRHGAQAVPHRAAREAAVPAQDRRGAHHPPHRSV